MSSRRRSSRGAAAGEWAGGMMGRHLCSGRHDGLEELCGRRLLLAQLRATLALLRRQSPLNRPRAYMHKRVQPLDDL